ncbi:MAG: minor capsid protein, partial [Oscillospiraceae bacterium]|nr:minor capsid protein [Oscillospiraceae bacterium]
MLTPDQIAALRDRAEQITEPITEFLLEDIARRISEAGQLTSTAAYQIWQAQQ